MFATLGTMLSTKSLPALAKGAGTALGTNLVGGLFSGGSSKPGRGAPPPVGGDVYKQAMANLMRDLPNQTRLSQRTPVTFSGDGGTPRHDRLQTLQAIANIRQGLG